MTHVSLAVKSLKEKGYLTQNPDPENRKRIRLFVTEHAKEIIHIGQLEQQQFVNLLERNLTEEGKLLWKEHLLQLTELLEQHIQENTIHERKY